MAFVAVDQDGEEKCFELEPHRTNYECWDDYDDLYVTIPKGSIKKLIKGSNTVTGIQNAFKNRYLE